MLDLNNIDIDEFNLKIESLDGLLVSRDSINRNIKAIKDDLANILGVNKNRVTSILKIFTNIRQEGEPFDEELVEKIKNLYVAYKEVE